MFLKEIELHVQNLLTIRDSIVNMVVGGGGEDLYDHLMNTLIFLLNDQWDIHMSFKNYEVNRYKDDLDLLIKVQ